MAIESDNLRALPNSDNAIPDGTTVSVRTANDVQYASTTTTGGQFKVTVDGCKGPGYYRYAVGAETRRRYSSSVGLAGALSLGDVVPVLKTIGDGVLSGYQNNLQVITAGAGLNVRVRNGVGLGAGIIYCQRTDNLTVGPFDAVVGVGNSRIDAVCFKTWPDGTAEEGRAELVIVKGVDAVSPTVPAITQDATVWHERLANVTIAFGAGSIGAGNIADTRRYANQANLTIQESDVTVVSTVSTLDFDGKDFNISDDGSGEARVAYTDEPWKRARFEEHFENFRRWDHSGQGQIDGNFLTARHGIIVVQSGSSNGNQHRWWLPEDGTGVGSGHTSSAVDIDGMWILSVGANTSLTLRIGWAGGTGWGTNLPNIGLWFEYEPATDASWQAIARNLGVETRVDLGGTVAVGQIYRLRMRRVGATAFFSIDGGAETSIATNLPSVAIGGGGQIETAQNVSKSVALDYYSHLVTGLP